MARAWVFSDLHLDANRQPFSLPKVRPECDMVICAGDICEGADRAIDWLADQKFGVPVVYVLGNHEFYRGEMRDEMEKALAAADHAGIHWLDCSHVDIGSTRVVGATLWTDYRLDGEAWRAPAMLAAQGMMNDHHLIRFGGRRFKPADAVGLHDYARHFIGGMLTESFDGAKVVVTHHAPSSKSIHANYMGSVLNGAFANNLDDLVDLADLWVHGHVHSRHDYRIGDGRVICNPRGYANERTGFDPKLVVDVGVRVAA